MSSWLAGRSVCVASGHLHRTMVCMVGYQGFTCSTSIVKVEAPTNPYGDQAVILAENFADECELEKQPRQDILNVKMWVFFFLKVTWLFQFLNGHATSNLQNKHGVVAN